MCKGLFQIAIFAIVTLMMSSPLIAQKKPPNTITLCLAGNIRSNTNPFSPDPGYPLWNVGPRHGLIDIAGVFCLIAIPPQSLLAVL